jgi:lipoprotein NlpD
VKPVQWGVLVAAVAAVAAGCASRPTPAPVVDARASKPVASKSATIKPSGDYYVVRRGDTLYSIALDHGTDYRDLAQWNGLDDPTRLRAGQQLRVKPPAGGAIAAAPAASPPAAPAEPERTAVAQVGSARILGRVESQPLDSLPPLPPRSAPKSELARMEAPKPEKPKAEPAKAFVPAATGFSQFIWPVKGKVLAEFAEPRRKGIDIDGRPGDPIVASAPGHVTYIGSGIPGLGKLVVLKHENGFITVYAHNRNIMVKEKQAVARGQQIAELGSTDSERPKLHFQIRKGAAAVDPLLYLPK